MSSQNEDGAPHTKKAFRAGTGLSCVVASAVLLAFASSALAKASSVSSDTAPKIGASLHDLQNVETRCGTHIGFFGSVTTVTLGNKILYRAGSDSWREAVAKVSGAHSIAHTPTGKWLINDGAADQMIQLENLDGTGGIIARSELGGFALSRPHDHIVDPKTGFIYMVDGRRLFRFRDLAGPVDVWSFPPDTVGYIRGMSWFDGRLHLADATRGEIHRVDDFDRHLMTTFKSPKPSGPATDPVPTRWIGGGSLSATGLMPTDVEKFEGWYYATNYFAPAFAQGGDPNPGRIIRWRSWQDFEAGRWEDLTDILPASDNAIIPYFMTVHGGALYFATPTSEGGPPPHSCFVRLDARSLRARASKERGK